MCHTLVQCTTCDLVYVERPPAAGELAHAYHIAEYDSPEEADDAATAYAGAIRNTLDLLPRRDSVLEIGAGNGAFLDHLAKQGFRRLAGVEPSSAAIGSAPAYRRAWIREAIFNESDFEPQSFDLICCFMTMEHVHDPSAVAKAAFQLLRPGGALVTVTHDYRSLVNRLLGQRSPIIDIEHMQLFSPRSIQFLFEDAGYSNIRSNAFINRYALRYWVRLAPMPRRLKQVVTHAMAMTRTGGVKLGFNVGNLMTAGFKQA